MWKYLVNQENNLRFAQAKMWVTSAKILENLQESRGDGENFLRPRLTIYRGGEGSFKKPPHFDRCEIFGGRVSTPTFWGWCFLRKFKGFRGNRSSESTRVTTGFKGKSECIEHMCARIKFHTCVDLVYTKTQCKSVKRVLKLYYMTECLKIVT
jgi:hypothetical protein